MTTVLAFGTFDAFHHGHEFFLASANKLGDRLVVGVARDAHILALKGRLPVQNERERLASLRDHPMVAKAVLCDERLGTYEILNVVQPDIIAIGHDQDALRMDLKRWLTETGRSIRMEQIAIYD
ncbi:hypothetical protein A2348_02485 [Candidatus Uhrbacteria bacterium RIFOXYB12_FULL_58_10]|uniref:Cytidyltransferase-like domain-containing protein n=1 Tax=Candidatus Uhrbacteria bacterium RIFOXYB2_FULL_57_15 TaxID=1802422 RepID=A0A1F7W5W4_9BACT|nr:MAG: hypothetical protein A2348_02485 [Candidatus Uhrbacteria bacterium RIFOXYB12_FULL_58_10]OGL98191.1 MAG: hypothetical protein A2304_03715 [Candidatus Uhrbacteria bacterium RIFOXYB2_FULL_57_15]OGL99165.1 MAG: hypothetical protein A2501_03130 [Candidatus Uhrbacteria bacterium RIFOXYC12_FULL_57_11]